MRKGEIHIIPEELKEKKGMLKKLPPSFFTGWQDRYVILKDKKLKYLTKESAKFASGVLNFDHFETTIERSEKDQTKFKLNISGISDRTFEFKAENAEKCKEWYDEIFKHIKFSDGFR